ncbi:melatonin receptor type 1B-B-like [Patiria miniata]|uniref:G-protein coupled receptors family 1 profile domain-containing protein n=1 Tax=Patiria miniata TaxID=46514 RepID=A0A914BA93_PATMI|nr:melatonin receptor type 1B-B-like [Patiria miniata]
MPNITLKEYVGLSVYDSYAEKQLLAALYGLIFVAGVLGNISVLLAVVLSRKPRTTTNVFVVNLAVADLITCLSLPIMILAVLSENRAKLLVSESLCTFHGVLVVVCIGCSINNITSIAVYRALITRRRNRSRFISLFNRRGLAALVTTNWLIPFTIGILPIVSEFGSYGYGDELSTCSFTLKANGSSTYSKIMLAVYYPVQLVVTFVSYALILITVIKVARKVNANPRQTVAVVGGAMRLTAGLRTTRPSVYGNVPASNLLQVPTPDRHLRGGTGRQAWTAYRPSSRAARTHPVRSSARPLLRRNREVTLSLFLVLFFFLICCTPFAVAIVLLQDRFHKFVPFLAALFISNSCINPVIYTARHPEFKAVIRCIIVCRLSKIPMKSSFLRRLLTLQERYHMEFKK